MSSSQPPIIPEEILRSEQKSRQPITPEPSPGVWGLPGLSPGIIDLMVKYGPLLVLAMAVVAGFGIFGMMLSPTPVQGVRQLGYMAVSLATTVGGVLCYMWLRERRRLGWNALAGLLILQMAGSLILSSAANILVNGFEVLIAVYIMLQLRDSYTK